MLFQNLRSNKDLIMRAGNSGNEGHIIIQPGGDQSTNIAKFGKTADLDLLGNLTASGNISASGTLYASAGDFGDGNITNVGIIDVDQVRADAASTTIIGLGSTVITNAIGGANITEIGSYGTKLGTAANHHVTASGNISSSAIISTTQLNVGNLAFVDRSSDTFRMGAGAPGGTSHITNFVVAADPGAVPGVRLNATSGDITASGNVSASGHIITNTLRGSTSGDQSGSLTLSGSLTFKANHAHPAVSASTLYVSQRGNIGTAGPHTADDFDLRFGRSGLTPAFAWVTLDDEGTDTSSEILFGVGSAVTSTSYNMDVVHDTTTNGTRIYAHLDGIYKVTANLSTDDSSGGTVIYDINVNGTTVHTVRNKTHQSVDPVERTQIYVGTINSGSYVTTTADGASFKYMEGSVLLVERLA
jgi:hypothetical protein